MSKIRTAWGAFEERRPGLAQLIMFSLLSSGMTVLQLVLMPAIKWAFGTTSLIDTSFQLLEVAAASGDQPFYVFDYAAGALPLGGGGLAYFLAVQITLLVAQVINFFLQRNITFKSNSNVWWAAFWYTVAYVVITFGAAVLQAFYKDPVYTLFMDTWGLGAGGEALADVATMLINACVSFWVFFPIFKIIFKQEPDDDDVAPDAAQADGGTEVVAAGLR
ncbi:hypothetical protein Sked_05140 [Sanguibacter keddieii DSM 10542]|uniref:GtrA-like protein domain-containing protein n=1 Tax=Sanguibacter keddieii (strain ATCC 51767 / DSM 10542 / NCFB 3025 / ST-74) TaxID=446469 RepID=D1BAC4_SANKS|nr:hypothetical protein [Sanguibacter keddieii]ACZ20475.1 hypothetical protein Sked_05140 [Sanguibacter keddieii DSM 10542]